MRESFAVAAERLPRPASSDRQARRGAGLQARGQRGAGRSGSARTQCDRDGYFAAPPEAAICFIFSTIAALTAWPASTDT